MLKVFKYLKSSIFSVLAIILLLFIQAFLDLTLPDYTSKIVNVGVQQGGIENAAIEKIGENTLNKLVLFMDSNDSKYILNHYEKTDTYKGEKIYTIKEDSNIAKISSIMAKPMLIVSFAEQSSSDNNASISFKIPEGQDLYQVLAMMDKTQKNTMLKDIDKKIKDIPDTIIDQAAVSYVKAEYQRIGVDTDQIQTMYILKVGLIMLGIAFAAMAIGILIVFIGSRMAARLARTLRHKVFTKVVGFSKNEIKTYGQSSLITRTTNDVQQVQMVVVFLLRVVFYAPIIGIGGVIKAMHTNADMTYIIGVAVVAILMVVISLFAIAMPKFNRVQKLIDKLNLVTREILSGLPVIRAFSNEKHEEERFEEANKRLTKVNLFINRAMSFMMPIMMLVMNFVCLVIVYQGAKGVDTGAMQVGDIMAYIQYTMQIIMAFLMISMMSIMLPRANVSAKRIMEVIETPDTIYNSKNLIDFNPKERGKVEFKNVSFRYPDADYDVITDINLVANPGETTAFIGSTGSGKSTLINLIPRFYDVTDGELLVDGVNIKDVDLKQLREKIGFVPQKGVLFTGTIKENIKYGNEKITDKDVNKALKIAQATEFVSKLKGGVDYDISQGGTNVSGGQKQRLSIARAIAKDPDIYVFDDSFSALDFKTDAKLRGELAKVTKNKTVLIVAQRISTIMNADKIVVLDEGNIVGIGTHKELMKNCNVYKEIALSQLSKEELENA
ncbi:MAG TPA: ABC transporter ATP-binding protein [Candidatus Faecimonas gallistercoris]|nr:ABC transporter ATP-binding protein [Candidatus Faecimonas gallistercoris]